MNPPPPIEETALATRADTERAMTNSFRARKGQLRLAEFEKNMEYRDLGLEVALAMVGIVKDGTATKEEKIKAAKGFSEVVKSHTLMQKNTLSIADSDVADDVPKPQQQQAPPPPIMINAPGAQFHNFPQETQA